MHDAPIAHGPGHLLFDHLQAVAEGAKCSAPAALAPLGEIAGRWHDLGKFRPGFQRYVGCDENLHVEGRAVVSAEKTHSAAGALHALQCLRATPGPAGAMVGWLLAHLIAGHHHGLYDHAALQDRLLPQGAGGPASVTEYREALAACTAVAPELLIPPATLDALAWLKQVPGLAPAGTGHEPEPLALSLAIRMLFSALVDADFLDTEAYFDADRAAARQGHAPLSWYGQRLDEHLSGLARQARELGREGDAVMRARAQVLADCRAAAVRAPGVFSLQVPTGGGKTLASLAFALAHAQRHGFDRVVVAIPYTSIVEQTADVLAGIFGRAAVVEHHSQTDADDARATARSRLACENWDAPLIVTTNVQLLESLFAARTSRCRKLHRLQRSVIVLDEAQVLPPPFLQPTLDALRLLSAHYAATIVSCTATQPILTDLQRFDARHSLRGLTRGDAKPHEIVREVAPLYAALERVRFEWPEDLHNTQELAGLAERMADSECVLAIVGTRRDAAELLAAADAAAPCGQRCLHLSAAMCGQHRADTIAEIRRRLQGCQAGDGRPLRVVSTQLVEAGVDVDFPVVLRALAGLDSIAQAAGRCNREGRLGPHGGRVEVFVRQLPTSLAALRRAADATRAVLGSDRPQTLAPTLFENYFRHWYGLFSSLDEKCVVDMLHNRRREDMQFESAACVYRLVDDEDQCSVVVPYTPTSGDARARDAALTAVLAGRAERWQLRALQRFVVQAPARDVNLWQSRGDVIEAMPGWYVLRNDTLYDPRRGLLREGAALDAATLFQ